MKILKIHVQDFHKPTIQEINHIRSLLRVIEVFEVRMQITSYRGQSLSKKIEKIIVVVDENTTPKMLFQLFSGTAKSTDIPSVRDFAQALETQSIPNKAAALVLFRIENYSAMNGGKIIGDNNNFSCIYNKKMQREHLLPQEGKDYWKDDLINGTKKRIEDIEESVNETINMIGNAFPVDDGSNKSMKNYSLDKKIKKYKSSNYANLVSIDGNEYGGKIQDSFTPDDIKERSKQISNLAKEIGGDID